MISRVRSQWGRYNLPRSITYMNTHTFVYWTSLLILTHPTCLQITSVGVEQIANAPVNTRTDVHRRTVSLPEQVGFQTLWQSYDPIDCDSWSYVMTHIYDDVHNLLSFKPAHYCKLILWQSYLQCNLITHHKIGLANLVNVWIGPLNDGSFYSIPAGLDKTYCLNNQMCIK